MGCYVDIAFNKSYLVITPLLPVPLIELKSILCYLASILAVGAIITFPVELGGDDYYFRGYCCYY